MSSSGEEEEIVDERSTSSQEEDDDEQSSRSRAKDDKEKKHIDYRLYEMFQQACNEFFQPGRLGDCEVKATDNCKSRELFCIEGEFEEVYDITGFSAFEVIAVMRALMNDRHRWTPPTTRKDFHFIIKRQDDEGGEVKMFKLMLLVLRPDRSEGSFAIVMHLKDESYIGKNGIRLCTETIETLAAKTRAKEFAEIIQKLLKDNSGIAQEKPVIAEQYFLFLFEIARRLSNEEHKTVRVFDSVPIASLIAREVKLLATVAENGDAAPSFKTGLESLSKFYGGNYRDRKACIKEIIEVDYAGRPTTKELCKKELEEIFGGSDIESSESAISPSSE